MSERATVRRCFTKKKRKEKNFFRSTRDKRNGRRLGSRFAGRVAPFVPARGGTERRAARALADGAVRTLEILAPIRGFCLSTLTANGPTRTRCAEESLIACPRQVDACFETEGAVRGRWPRASAGSRERERLRCGRRARETTPRARASRCDEGQDARAERRSIFRIESWLRTSSFFFWKSLSV